MYYIYKETIGFYESPTAGVVAYAFPRSLRAAEEMMTQGRARYSFVRSLPRSTPETIKRHANSLATLYGEGVPEDFSTVQSLKVPSIYFVLGSTAKRYAVSKEDFDSFVQDIATHKSVQEKRKMELENMTYADLTEYFLNFPIQSRVKDQLMIAISNLGGTSVGTDLSTTMTNRQALEAAYSILKGMEESGDDSTLNSLILIGSADSNVDYTEAED